MILSPEFRPFLAAIRESPGDDLPRHVAADFLDEHGDADRARFIRLQLAIAAGDDRCYQQSTAIRCICPVLRCRCKPCTLRRRERELLGKFGQRWRDEAMQPARDAWEVRGRTKFFEGSNADLRRQVDERVREWGWLMTDCVSFRRGFPATVRMPLDAALRWLPELVRLWPLEEVRVTDREPERDIYYGGISYYRWHHEKNPLAPPATCISGRIFTAAVTLSNLEGDFLTSEAAHAALSAALLTLARAPQVPPAAAQ